MAEERIKVINNPNRIAHFARLPTIKLTIKRITDTKPKNNATPMIMPPMLPPLKNSKTYAGKLWRLNKTTNSQKIANIPKTKPNISTLVSI